MTLFNKDTTKIAQAGCYYILVHILCRLYYEFNKQRFGRCIKHRFSFVKERKKIYNAFNAWLMFKHLLFSEFPEINWIYYINIKQRRNYGKVSTPRIVQLDTNCCFLFFFQNKWMKQVIWFFRYCLQKGNRREHRSLWNCR